MTVTRWLTRWLWAPAIALVLTAVVLAMLELQGHSLRAWVTTTGIAGNALLLAWNGFGCIEMRRLRQEINRRQAEPKGD